MGLVRIRMMYVGLYYPTCKHYEKKLLQLRQFLIFSLLTLLYKSNGPFCFALYLL